MIIQKGPTILDERVTVCKKHRSVQAPVTTIMPYTSTRKGTPSVNEYKSQLSVDNDSHKHHQTYGQLLDFGFVLSRMYATEVGEWVPSWTGFNSQLVTSVPEMSKIGYLPVIDAPVTDMATVNELLRHSSSIRIRLQLPKIVLIFDEAIYAKNHLVIRLGDFKDVGLEVRNLFLLL